MLKKVCEIFLCVFGAAFVMLGGALMVTGAFRVSGLIAGGNPHIEENLLYILIFIGGGLFALGVMFLIVMEFLSRR